MSCFASLTQSFSRITKLLIIISVVGCGSSEPFSMVTVSGKVTYEDGTLIPAERIVVNFVPLAQPKNAKTHPRPGQAEVDETTGKFDSVTSHKYADGIVKGEHKVFLSVIDSKHPDLRLIPDIYGSETETPIQFNTRERKLEIKVPRP